MPANWIEFVGFLAVLWGLVTGSQKMRDCFCKTGYTALCEVRSGRFFGKVPKKRPLENHQITIDEMHDLVDVAGKTTDILGVGMALVWAKQESEEDITISTEPSAISEETAVYACHGNEPNAPELLPQNGVGLVFRGDKAGDEPAHTFLLISEDTPTAWRLKKAIPCFQRMVLDVIESYWVCKAYGKQIRQNEATANACADETKDLKEALSNTMQELWYLNKRLVHAGNLIDQHVINADSLYKGEDAPPRSAKMHFAEVAPAVLQRCATDPESVKGLFTAVMNRRNDVHEIEERTTVYADPAMVEVVDDLINEIAHNVTEKILQGHNAEIIRRAKMELTRRDLDDPTHAHRRPETFSMGHVVTPVFTLLSCNKKDKDATHNRSASPGAQRVQYRRIMDMFSMKDPKTQEEATGRVLKYACLALTPAKATSYKLVSHGLLDPKKVRAAATQSKPLMVTFLAAVVLAVFCFLLLLGSDSEAGVSVKMYTVVSYAAVLAVVYCCAVLVEVYNEAPPRLFFLREECRRLFASKRRKVFARLGFASPQVKQESLVSWLLAGNRNAYVEDKEFHLRDATEKYWEQQRLLAQQQQQHQRLLAQQQHLLAQPQLEFGQPPQRQQQQGSCGFEFGRTHHQWADLGQSHQPPPSASRWASANISASRWTSANTSVARSSNGQI